MKTALRRAGFGPSVPALEPQDTYRAGVRCATCGERHAVLVCRNCGHAEESHLVCDRRGEWRDFSLTDHYELNGYRFFFGMAVAFAVGTLAAAFTLGRK